MVIFLNNYQIRNERDTSLRTFFDNTNKVPIPTDNTQFQRLGYPENTTTATCRTTFQNRRQHPAIKFVKKTHQKILFGNDRRRNSLKIAKKDLDGLFDRRNLF
ncbi:hypothetical protein DXT94_23580 [Rhizobium sp. ICMP 5592]|nr:hypothetical protein [Rhizobium sp. ICMP 5592]